MTSALLRRAADVIAHNRNHGILVAIRLASGDDIDARDRARDVLCVHLDAANLATWDLDRTPEERMAALHGAADEADAPVQTSLLRRYSRDSWPGMGEDPSGKQGS